MAELEMKMDRPTKKPNMVAQVILYVLIAALVFGIGGYYLGTRQVKSTSTTASPSAVASKPASASATSSVDATANWKTYTNDTYGFSFKYPSDWNKPQFVKHANIMDLKGTSYSTFSDSEQLKLDSDGVFSMAFNTKDYEAYGGGAIDKPISANWTKEEFQSQIQNIKPIVYKKLSEKALLIGYYSNIECSQSLNLLAITNLNSTYPNLEILINGVFDNDQIIKNAEKEAQATNKDVCDLESAYREVAQKVQAGTYSNQLNSYIDIAAKIADTVQAK